MMKTLTSKAVIPFASLMLAWAMMNVGDHFVQAQTATARPSLTAFGPMVPVQVKLTGLTSAGYTWIPMLHTGTGPGKFAISSNNPNGDVYLGQSQRDRSGKLILGTVAGASSPQVTIQDSTGFVVANAWGATTTSPLLGNNTYNLDNLSGVWLQGGFKITCTDANAGVDCRNINAELFWQQ